MKDNDTSDEAFIPDDNSFDEGGSVEHASPLGELNVDESLVLDGSSLGSSNRGSNSANSEDSSVGAEFGRVVGNPVGAPSVKVPGAKPPPPNRVMRRWLYRVTGAVAVVLIGVLFYNNMGSSNSTSGGTTNGSSTDGSTDNGINEQNDRLLTIKQLALLDDEKRRSTINELWQRIERNDARQLQELRTHLADETKDSIAVAGAEQEIALSYQLMLKAIDLLLNPKDANATDGSQANIDRNMPVIKFVSLVQPGSARVADDRTKARRLDQQGHSAGNTGLHIKAYMYFTEAAISWTKAEDYSRAVESVSNALAAEPAGFARAFLPRTNDVQDQIVRAVKVATETALAIGGIAYRIAALKVSIDAVTTEELPQELSSEQQEEVKNQRINLSQLKDKLRKRLDALEEMVNQLPQRNYSQIEVDVGNDLLRIRSTTSQLDGMESEFKTIAANSAAIQAKSQAIVASSKVAASDQKIAAATHKSHVDELLTDDFKQRLQQSRPSLTVDIEAAIIDALIAYDSTDQKNYKLEDLEKWHKAARVISHGFAKLDAIAAVELLHKNAADWTSRLARITKSGTDAQKEKFKGYEEFLKGLDTKWKNKSFSELTKVHHALFEILTQLENAEAGISAVTETELANTKTKLSMAETDIKSAITDLESTQKNLKYTNDGIAESGKTLTSRLLSQIKNESEKLRRMIGSGTPNSKSTSAETSIADEILKKHNDEVKELNDRLKQVELYIDLKSTPPSQVKLAEDLETLHQYVSKFARWQNDIKLAKAIDTVASTAPTGVDPKKLVESVIKDERLKKDLDERVKKDIADRIKDVIRQDDFNQKLADGLATWWNADGTGKVTEIVKKFAFPTNGSQSTAPGVATLVCPNQWIDVAALRAEWCCHYVALNCRLQELCRSFNCLQERIDCVSSELNQRIAKVELQARNTQGQVDQTRNELQQLKTNLKNAVSMQSGQSDRLASHDRKLESQGQRLDSQGTQLKQQSEKTLAQAEEIQKIQQMVSTQRSASLETEKQIRDQIDHQSKVAGAKIDNVSQRVDSIDARVTDMTKSMATGQQLKDVSAAVELLKETPRPIPQVQMTSLEEQLAIIAEKRLSQWGYGPPNLSPDPQPGTPANRLRARSHFDEAYQRTFFSSAPGATAASVRLLASAVEDDPTQPLYRYYLGLALRQADRSEDGLKQIQIGARLEKRSGNTAEINRRMERVQYGPRQWLERIRTEVVLVSP